MMAAVNKDTIHALAEVRGCSHSEAREILKQVAESMTGSLRRGDEVKFPGMGTFKPITRPARAARNPITGETVDVPERRDVKFRAHADLKAVL
jgi:DNA-binding protein HU-beta